MVGSRDGIAPVTPLRAGGLSTSPPERTVSTVRKVPRREKDRHRQSHTSARAHTQQERNTHCVRHSRVVVSSRSTDTTDTSALQCVCAQADVFLKTATSTPTGHPLVHQRTDTMYSKSQEGSVPLLLSGPCRLCVKSPVAKKTVTVRVTRLRVHTRNKNATHTVSGTHSLTHSLTQGSSCRHAVQTRQTRVPYNVCVHKPTCFSKQLAPESGLQVSFGPFSCVLVRAFRLIREWHRHLFRRLPLFLLMTWPS